MKRAARTVIPILAAPLLAPVLAVAQGWPAKPVTLVSALAAGTVVEAVTRAWMQCVSSDKRANQPFILINKPGGNGVVAAQHMRTLPNDGYSVLLGGMSQTTITPFIFKKQPYDPEKEYQGAAIYATSTLTLVTGTQSGIKSIDELVAYAKSRPGGIDFGIPAIATPAHLLSAAVADKLGIPAQIVPTAGEAGGLSAILGGHVPVMSFLTGTSSPRTRWGPAMGRPTRAVSTQPKVGPMAPTFPT